MQISQLRRACAAFAGLTLVSGIGFASASATAAGVMPLVSHRAVYDLSLSETNGDQAPAAASGRIVYQFTGSACSGYVTDFRQVTELDPVQGPTRTSDMRSSTFEDGRARSLHFATETSVNGQATPSVEGEAKKKGGALAIALSKPDQATIHVDQDVAFPTEQIVRIIAAAKAGQHLLPLKVFDGSDNGEKIYNTLAVIGAQAKTPPVDKAAQSGLLRTTPRWPVTISYFDQSKSDAPPNYVLSFDLYENGVSGNLRLNYGDFTLKGDLTKFTLLPQKGGC